MTRSHTPSLSGLPLCGEGLRWRRKNRLPFRMTEGTPTCGHCLHVLSGYGQTRVDRWIERAAVVLDAWRAARVG